MWLDWDMTRIQVIYKWKLVIRIDCNIAGILPIRIDVSSFNKNINFGTKITWIRLDNKY